MPDILEEYVSDDDLNFVDRDASFIDDDTLSPDADDNISFDDEPQDELPLRSSAPEIIIHAAH